VPAALEEYEMYEKDGIKVYVDKKIKTLNGLIHFKLDKLLMFEKVIAHGLDLDFERK